MYVIKVQIDRILKVCCLPVIHIVTLKIILIAYICNKKMVMKINYRFTSDIEPTDEQLHLLMQDVAIEAKEKARKSDKKFFSELQQMFLAVQKK